MSTPAPITDASAVPCPWDGTFGRALLRRPDRTTAGHCERVAGHAAMLAEWLGVGGRETRSIEHAGLLHDVGKVAIPREVLHKPGRLDPVEWARMKTHPEVGERIVAGLGLSREVRRAVRHHHEWWCGHGYPDGLAGEEIPFQARVVAVADTFDALTSVRTYRPTVSRWQALAIMARDAGRILDPEIFRVFREITIAQGPRLRAA